MIPAWRLSASPAPWRWPPRSRWAAASASTCRASAPTPARRPPITSRSAWDPASASPPRATSSARDRPSAPPSASTPPIARRSKTSSTACPPAHPRRSSTASRNAPPPSEERRASQPLRAHERRHVGEHLVGPREEQEVVLARDHVDRQIHALFAQQRHGAEGIALGDPIVGRPMDHEDAASPPPGGKRVAAEHLALHHGREENEPGERRGALRRCPGGAGAAVGEAGQKDAARVRAELVDSVDADPLDGLDAAGLVPVAKAEARAEQDEALLIGEAAEEIEVGLEVAGAAVQKEERGELLAGRAGRDI